MYSSHEASSFDAESPARSILTQTNLLFKKACRGLAGHSTTALANLKIALRNANQNKRSLIAITAFGVITLGLTGSVTNSANSSHRRLVYGARGDFLNTAAANSRRDLNSFSYKYSKPDAADQFAEAVAGGDNEIDVHDINNFLGRHVDGDVTLFETWNWEDMSEYQFASYFKMTTRNDGMSPTKYPEFDTQMTDVIKTIGDKTGENVNLKDGIDTEEYEAIMEAFHNPLWEHIGIGIGIAVGVTLWALILFITAKYGCDDVKPKDHEDGNREHLGRRLADNLTSPNAMESIPHPIQCNDDKQINSEIPDDTAESKILYLGLAIVPCFFVLYFIYKRRFAHTLNERQNCQRHETAFAVRASLV